MRHPPDFCDVCRCGPCRQVAPHLSNIARKYRDKGLKVIGLSLDDVSPTLHQFVASQGDKMDYTVSCISNTLLHCSKHLQQSLRCGCAECIPTGLHALDD